MAANVLERSVVGTWSSNQNRAGAVNPSIELQGLFSVPFLRLRWLDSEELNRELSELVLQRAQSDRGIKISNVEGWHSPKDLHLWEAPCIKRLVERFYEAGAIMVRQLYGPRRTDLLDGWELESWANVNRKGAYNRPHEHGDHSTNVWSGVYYVSTGVPRGADVSSVGGFTKFENRSLVPLPLSESGRVAPLEHTVVPEPGLMVLFPATLRHYVETYVGDGERVTIAFNLRSPKLGIARYPDMLEPNWRWKNFRGFMVCYAWIAKSAKRLLRRAGARR